MSIRSYAYGRKPIGYVKYPLFIRKKLKTKGSCFSYRSVSLETQVSHKSSTFENFEGLFMHMMPNMQKDLVTSTYQHCTTEDYVGIQLWFLR